MHILQAKREPEGLLAWELGQGEGWVCRRVEGGELLNVRGSGALGLLGWEGEG